MFAIHKYHLVPASSQYNCSACRSPVNVNIVRLYGSAFAYPEKLLVMFWMISDVGVSGWGRGYRCTKLLAGMVIGW
jgi:hypothetical protein